MQMLNECLSNEMWYDMLLVCVSLPLSLAIAFTSSSESCTSCGIVGWCGFIHLCVYPAVQWGCGRCPFSVRVATEFQFARYTLVKITFIFFISCILKNIEPLSWRALFGKAGQGRAWWMDLNQSWKQSCVLIFEHLISLTPTTVLYLDLIDLCVKWRQMQEGLWLFWGIYKEHKWVITGVVYPLKNEQNSLDS